MKPFKLILIIILLGATIFTLGSCKDDDDADNSKGDIYLTCKADGVNFTANPAEIEDVIANDITFSFKGYSSAKQGIFITIATNYGGIGTYDLSFSQGNNASYLAPTNDGSAFGDIYSSNGGNGAGGELIVTFDDGTYLEGTFSFRAVRESTTINITEGEFRIKQS